MRGEDYEKLQTMSFVFPLACSFTTGKTIRRNFMVMTRKKDRLFLFVLHGYAKTHIPG